MSKNDITGDEIKSRPASTDYCKNYDSIFGKRPSLVIVDDLLDDDPPPSQEDLDLAEADRKAHERRDRDKYGV